MSYINEDRIINIIEDCLNNGKDTFVIYPFGVWGKKVKYILNTFFGIMELAIVDNKLAKDKREILCIDDLEEVDNDIIILLSSDNQNIWHEIRNELYTKAKVWGGKTIIDLAEINISKNECSFNLIGKKSQIKECSDEQVQRIFERTQAVWKRFGEQEPYWSVFTHNEFKIGNIDSESLKKFYMSGLPQAIKIVSTVVRNEIAKNKEELNDLDILEIGCGCGRVTKHLANYFKKVVAVDLSRGNIDVARRMVNKNNVEFCLIENINTYNLLPQSDVVYSYLVLQHNCPPIIEYMIMSMLRCTKMGGIAIFQVPTYKRDYKFEYDTYMSEETDRGVMEMHTLPQKRIFEIAYESNCIPLEVYPAYSTGQNDNSTWFVLKKCRV